MTHTHREREEAQSRIARESKRTESRKQPRSNVQEKRYMLERERGVRKRKRQTQRKSEPSESKASHSVASWPWLKKELCIVVRAGKAI